VRAHIALDRYMSTRWTISRAYSQATGTAEFELWGRIFRIQGGQQRRGMLHPFAGASRTWFYGRHAWP